MKTIAQSVKFAATPDALFDLYMDAKKHAAATGAEASITRKVGAPFTALDGSITGHNLAVVPKRLVVQRWISNEWDDEEPASTLVLAFSPDANGARVDLVHANVPDDHAAALDAAWHESYWKPWRAWLKKK
ncbi:MAG TPA: SRPBCC domain-containing protein [Candidatus Thermoplasmatota archaeon]|nr:SRPBCC domain-containing protein [Candidatus Thermoplasmatota archaeon]